MDVSCDVTESVSIEVFNLYADIVKIYAPVITTTVVQMKAANELAADRINKTAILA